VQGFVVVPSGVLTEVFGFDSTNRLWILMIFYTISLFCAHFNIPVLCFSLWPSSLSSRQEVGFIYAINPINQSQGNNI